MQLSQASPEGFEAGFTIMLSGEESAELGHPADGLMTPGGLGTMAGIGTVVARWEKFHLNPYPTQAR